MQKNNNYKYIIFLSIIYSAILILTMVIENHMITIFSIQILSGTLVLPLSYCISDAITEVYGYQEMRRLVWFSIITLYLVAFIIYIILHLPSSSYSRDGQSYYMVLHSFPEDIFTYSIAAIIGTISNAYILSKWKIFWKGRYFWLRSLGSTMAGEGVFILVWGILGFSYKFEITLLLKLMLVSYLCKIFYNLIMIIPTTIIVKKLKKAEGVDTYDQKIDFNPFLMKIYKS